MTASEFQKWFDHFAAAFPAVQDFVRKYDPTGKATLTLWYEVLKKRDIGDCLAVTNELFGRQQPPWVDKGGYHDWSAVPRHVSRLCGEMHPVVPEWKQHTVRDRSKVGIIDSDPSMAEALEKSLDAASEFVPLSPEWKAAVSACLDGIYGHKQSPAAARDKGNYEPAFDAFNQS